MEELSEEQIEEFKEAFSLFDPDNKGEIQTKELGTVFRSLGIYTSGKDQEELNEEGEPVISFQEFLKKLMKKIADTRAEDELADAFSLFVTNGEKDEIKIANFKKEFKEYLPNIPEQEVNELCDFLKKENGDSIIVKEAVEKLNSRLKNHMNK